MLTIKQNYVSILVYQTTKEVLLMINISRLEKFMHSKGWSEPMLARELDVDYSYLYRLLRGEKNGGGKVYIGILRICNREGLDVFDFVNIEQNKKKE